MDIGIVGAGFSGLLAAKHLSQEAKVTVYEKRPYPGGLAASMNLDGVLVEKFNHYFSRKDAEFLRIVKELGLGDKIFWKNTKQAGVFGEKLYKLNNFMDVLRLPGLTLLSKIKTGIFFIENKFNKSGLPSSAYNIDEYIIKKCGKEAFDVFFRPLLEFKFSKNSDINAAYLWARLREDKKNRIGYLRGGLNQVFKAMCDKVKKDGAEVLLDNPVRNIFYDEENKRWQVYAARTQKRHDIIILSIPATQALRICPAAGEEYGWIGDLEYLSAAGYLIKLKNPLKEGYWLFNCSAEDKAPRIIIDSTLFTGKTFIYLPVYMQGAVRKFPLEDSYEYFKKINPEFNEDWVEQVHFFSEEYAEPVLNKTLFTNLLRGEINFKGLYIPEIIFERSLLKSLNSITVKIKQVVEDIRGKYVWHRSS
ncbi:MAG: FAD-dependent oxidoreductase [Candidatus Omnitrophica bacterium]|nr:FAD-dependent oxidoreductase [Candidatus Omnitrophota bacterium]MBU1925267.1 FAD-dependent oxidoreductase [Candidatus Omnitrophota bacterium]